MCMDVHCVCLCTLWCMHVHGCWGVCVHNSVCRCIGVDWVSVYSILYIGALVLIGCLCTQYCISVYLCWLSVCVHDSVCRCIGVDWVSVYTIVYVGVLVWLGVCVHNNVCRCIGVDWVSVYTIVYVSVWMLIVVYVGVWIFIGWICVHCILNTNNSNCFNPYLTELIILNFKCLKIPHFCLIWDETFTNLDVSRLISFPITVA